MVPAPETTTFLPLMPVALPVVVLNRSKGRELVRRSLNMTEASVHTQEIFPSISSMLLHFRRVDLRKGNKANQRMKADMTTRLVHTVHHLQRCQPKLGRSTGECFLGMFPIQGRLIGGSILLGNQPLSKDVRTAKNGNTNVSTVLVWMY